MGSFHSQKAALLLMLSLLPGWVWFSAGPAAAQGPAAIMEKPGPEKAEEEKKEEAPTTCGPLVSDSCLPIETHHACLQILWAYAPVYAYAPVRGFSTLNWRRVSAGGNFSTFVMPVKFTYGPMKNLETYIIVPFIANFASSLDIPGPNGETSASYAGIGDISWFVKYLVLEESDLRPAVTAVFGTGFPSGHASHLNPGRLLTDAIGTGAFAFTTGVNLYKWLKPFLVYSNIWLTSPVNLFPDNGSNVRSREYLTFNLAVEYPFTQKWVALLEFYSTWTWTNFSPTTPQGFQSPATLLGILPGIEYFITDKWAVSAGAAIDLAGKATTLKATPILTMYYSF